jgi:hypothetical protein
LEKSSESLWFGGKTEFVDDFRFVFRDFNMAYAGGKCLEKRRLVQNFTAAILSLSKVTYFVSTAKPPKIGFSRQTKIAPLLKLRLEIGFLQKRISFEPPSVIVNKSKNRCL